MHKTAQAIHLLSSVSARTSNPLLKAAEKLWHTHANPHKREPDDQDYLDLIRRGDRSRTLMFKRAVNACRDFARQGLKFNAFEQSYRARLLKRTIQPTAHLKSWLADNPDRQERIQGSVSDRFALAAGYLDEEMEVFGDVLALLKALHE